MASNKQLTLTKLKARIENLEISKIVFFTLCINCGVDIMDALAPIGHANERSYVEKRSEGSRRKKSHIAAII